MAWKPCLLIAALGVAGCAPDPYASLAVVSVSPDHVTVRCTEVGARNPLAAISAMAEAQCAEVGRLARFQRDIELISEDQSRVRGAAPSPETAPVRLRKQGFHQVHFLCVEP